jgi:hypothetical protein
VNMLPGPGATQLGITPKRDCPAGSSLAFVSCCLLS